jgi:hypothetical protein
LSLSAAVLGFVEASGRTTAEKNRLLRPNPWPNTPFDFLRAILLGIETEVAWTGEADIQAWTATSRLNLVAAMDSDPDQPAVKALQARLFTALFPALENLRRLAGSVSDAERARIYEAPDS